MMKPLATPAGREIRTVFRTRFKPQMQNDLTTEKKIACRKLSLLEFVGNLRSIRKACRVMGCSRQ